MGSATDLTQEILGLNPAGEQKFFFKKQYFLHTRFFLNLALIALLLGIPSTQ